MKSYLELLYAFVRVGLFTFGGGYAIVPVVERELIKRKSWVTMEEVMEYYTISQITPGLIGVNLSTFIGNRQKGILGGIIATLGFVLPGTTIVILVAMLIGNIADIPAVGHAFVGIRIAVAALILDTVIKMVKGVFKDIAALVIYITVFGISILPLGILPSQIRSPVTLVLLSGLAGFIIYSMKRKKA